MDETAVRANIIALSTVETTGKKDVSLKNTGNEK